MRFFVIYLLVTITLCGYAQGGFKRQYKLPGALNNTSKAVFETTPGNYIMAGFTVEEENGYQANRLVLFGINSQGQRTWTKKYGNHQFEYLDNIFVVKWFYKQGDFLYHAGAVRDSNNKYLGVLMKFDLNGDTVWQKKFYEVNEYVYPQMVTGSIDGGFLITGLFSDHINHIEQVLLIKTDANGNELWRKHISKAGHPVHDGKAILQDTASKKIVIVGYQYIGSSIKDNLIICDSFGNKLGQYSHCGAGYGGLFFDVIQTKDKSIVAVGNIIDPATLGGINLTRSYALKIDINSPANPIWIIDNFDKLAMGNSFGSVKELNNNDLLIAGGIDTMQQNNLPSQIYNRITRIDKNGIVKWNRHYNYSANTVNPNILSIMNLEIASNGDWLAAVQVNNQSPNPFFFVRYDSLGCDSSVTYCGMVGIEERKKTAEAIDVYPNPFTSQIHIEFTKDVPTNKLKAEVYDVAGRVVREEEFFIDATNKKHIDLSELHKGMYFVKVSDADHVLMTRKVMKE